MAVIEPPIQLKPRVKLNVAAYDAFVASPENAQRHFELIDGEIVEMPSPYPLHSLLIFWLLKLLDRLDPRGWVLGDNNDLIITPTTVLKPDGMYYRSDRLPDPRQRLTTPPTVAIEVASPSNTVSELRDKAVIYLDFGVDMVWLILPEARTVEVVQRVSPHELRLRRFLIDDTVDLSDTLPGLAFPVRDLFARFDEGAL